MATLFGRALTAGRGWMHIAIVMALFVTIFIRKSRRSRTQAVGSEKQAIITVLKNRYWLIVKKYKKEAGKKVPFLIWVKRKAERRRSICDWLCPAFLNAVLLNWFIQDRTQIYGQTAVFARNRHFSSRSFTDRRLIFIDVSVNGKLFLVISIMEGDHPFFRFETDFFPASFRLDINKTIIMKLFVR